MNHSFDFTSLHRQNFYSLDSTTGKYFSIEEVFTSGLHYLPFQVSDIFI